MALTDIFIKRPVLSVVVSLLILLLGLRAASVLPIRQYPKLSNTVVNVTTVYPGASASLIQGFITTPLEQAVASAEGVDYITSSSVQGTSTIQVYIKLNFDPNQVLTEDAYRKVLNPELPRAERIAAFQGRASWFRTLGDGGYVSQINRMVSHFGDMGIVEQRPGVPGDRDFPPAMQVENRIAPTQAPGAAQAATSHHIEPFDARNEEQLQSLSHIGPAAPR